MQIRTRLNLTTMYSHPAGSGTVSPVEFWFSHSIPLVYTPCACDGDCDGPNHAAVVHSMQYAATLGCEAAK